MAYMTENFSVSPSLVERILERGAHLLERAAARHARNRIYNKTASELYALSNRDLADLGISRSEIRRIAWEAANGHLAR